MSTKVNSQSNNTHESTSRSCYESVFLIRSDQWRRHCRLKFEDHYNMIPTPFTIYIYICWMHTNNTTNISLYRLSLTMTITWTNIYRNCSINWQGAKEIMSEKKGEMDAVSNRWRWLATISYCVDIPNILNMSLCIVV